SMDTFRTWISKDYDNLKQRYEDAKLNCMESMSAELATIVSTPLTDEEKQYPIAFKKRELRMKQLQWELEKRHRSIYGNHVSIEHKHTIDLKPILDKVDERIRTRRLKTVQDASNQPEKTLELPSNTKHD
ncbi:hypothetical protein, partial [Candidatus Liberibacter brunswickensis]|uniref:hypothetical protein n=1 Tax=Candidatus Liberibacter brunswickensis TaxID=1968796 RepID=UPI002FDFB0D6